MKQQNFCISEHVHLLPHWLVNPERLAQGGFHFLAFLLPIELYFAVSSGRFHYSFALKAPKSQAALMKLALKLGAKVVLYIIKTVLKIGAKILLTTKLALKLGAKVVLHIMNLH